MADILSEVLLLRAPLENDYKHTYYWEDLNEQASFFKGMKRFEANDLTYVKHEEKIRWHQKYEEICDCNYVMYRNAPSQKWFYAFITKMVYVDEGRTDIYIERDVFQTWITQINVQYSFIEREHVDDDTIGAHTVPEQLETGDYVISDVVQDQSLLTTGIVVACTVNTGAEVNGKYENAAGGYYNGVYSGVKYYYCDSEGANKLLKDLADKGQADAVTGVFHAPSLHFETTAAGEYLQIKQKNDPEILSWDTVLRAYSFGNYEPENKKLFTYPYCYMLMDNGCGGSAIYKFEQFRKLSPENRPVFRTYVGLTPGCSIFCTPMDYNNTNTGDGNTPNFAEKLTMGKFPVCSWNTDVYTNWLTQNSINIGTQVLSSAFQVVGGAGMMLTGAGALAGAGSMASGFLGIANTVGEVYAHSLQPPQAEGNLNSGDITFSAKQLTFTAYRMQIREEYARIIDQYFHAYGYKVNRIGVPLKKHRRQFWFTKTIDANIECPAPMDDVRKIKAAYDRGITFWHNIIWEGGYVFPIGDYNVTNSIIN
jgi:hypothetical protein